LQGVDVFQKIPKTIISTTNMTTPQNVEQINIDMQAAEQHLRRRKTSNDSFQDSSNFSSTHSIQDVGQTDRQKSSTTTENRKMSTKSAPFAISPSLTCGSKPRSFSTSEQQSTSTVQQSLKLKVRERKRGKVSINNRIYIQTDNPFLVVRRKELSFSEVNNDNNNSISSSNSSSSSCLNNNNDQNKEEEEKLDVVNELKAESRNPYLPTSKKNRSISQSNLCQVKVKQDFPKRLVRQRSNTIIGRLPVFSRDEDEEDEEAEYEVVDVRSEIFRIKDQFDDLLGALDGRLFAAGLKDLGDKTFLLKDKM
jgi:hypothetical protein